MKYSNQYEKKSFIINKKLENEKLISSEDIKDINVIIEETRRVKEKIE